MRETGVAGNITPIMLSCNEVLLSITCCMLVSAEAADLLPRLALASVGSSFRSSASYTSPSLMSLSFSRCSFCQRAVISARMCKTQVPREIARCRGQGRPPADGSWDGHLEYFHELELAPRGVTLLPASFYVGLDLHEKRSIGAAGALLLPLLDHGCERLSCGDKRCTVTYECLAVFDRQLQLRLGSQRRVASSAETSNYGMLVDIV